MMRNDQTPTVKTFLFCEETRQEKNNKYIIIGVFAGGLKTRELPASVPLAFYLEILSMPLGRMKMALRVSGPGEGEFEMPIIADTIELNKVFVLATPRLEITLECEGELLVEVKFGDGDYYEVGRMKIEADPTLHSAFSIQPVLQDGQSPLDPGDPDSPLSPSPQRGGKKRARF